MASGSSRNANIGGVSFAIMGDSDITLNPLVTREAIPHSAGALIKETLEAGNAEGIKLTVTPSQYVLLRDLTAEIEISLSYETRDRSIFRTTGAVHIVSYTSQDFAAEVQFLTSTGKWDVEPAS